LAAYSQSVEDEEINNIVETMKKKYREQGMEFSEVSGTLSEIKNIISAGNYAKFDIESKDDLEGFNSGFAKKFGEIYLTFKKQLKPIQDSLKKVPLSDELGYYLYSANMNYSANQYLALTSAVVLLFVLIGFFIGTIMGLVLLSTPVFAIMLPPAVAISFGLIGMFLMFMIPRQKANERGNACSMELPFALRQMSTELRAGIGFYKAMQSITTLDYGVLSDEFTKTIVEIEEGTDAAIALKHLALRTQSKPLRATVNHITRAMRIGGNLSSAMNDIAKEVSEEQRNNIRVFAQTMNFFAIVFIFIGIVMPVGVSILGIIRNSPISQTSNGMFNAIPLSPLVLLLFYVFVMPIVFAGLIFIVKASEPKI
jgi:flagellar protein FlaJ